jgi:hypothetical protein
MPRRYLPRSAIVVSLLVGSLPAPRLARADPTPRSRSRARLLSLGGTLASAAITGAGGLMLAYGFANGRGYDQRYGGLRRNGKIVAGIGGATTLFTPSIGAWSSGEALTTGAEIRASGIALGLLGVAIYFATKSPCQQFGDSCLGGSPPNATAATVPIVLGGIVYLGGITHDIFVDAPAAADRYNARHITASPVLLPTATGAVPGLGVGVGGTF